MHIERYTRNVLNLARSPMQSIPSLLPQEDYLDSEDSPEDVFGEAGPAAPAAEPLQVVLQDRVQPRSREASDGGGRGRHGMREDFRYLSRGLISK